MRYYLYPHWLPLYFNFSHQDKLMVRRMLLAFPQISLPIAMTSADSIDHYSTNRHKFYFGAGKVFSFPLNST